MERVEVLKGTQGTLQGVVSSGGAIHMYTKDPEIGADSNNAYVKTGFADNNMQVFEFGTDFQLSDTMAMRLPVYLTMMVMKFTTSELKLMRIMNMMLIG